MATPDVGDLRVEEVQKEVHVVGAYVEQFRGGREMCRLDLAEQAVVVEKVKQRLVGGGEPTAVVDDQFGPGGLAGLDHGLGPAHARREGFLTPDYRRRRRRLGGVEHRVVVVAVGRSDREDVEVLAFEQRRVVVVPVLPGDLPPVAQLGDQRLIEVGDRHEVGSLRGDERPGVVPTDATEPDDTGSVSHCYPCPLARLQRFPRSRPGRDLPHTGATRSTGPSRPAAPLGITGNDRFGPPVHGRTHPA